MDDTRSIYDVIDATGAAGGGERATGGAGPADAAPPVYLESGGKDCEKRAANEYASRVESEQYEVVPCGCRSRFCKGCCVGLGLSLRERLVPVLTTFKGLMMWTFTVDPKLFSSPLAAFLYVRENRCISNVMRELRRRGLVNSGRYFVVVEWQMGKGDEEGTLMAHWHVLADASFIAFDTVCELWNRFRPEAAGPVEGDRPGFGSVRFSAPRFESAVHAANYACKYLIKYPEKGYPEWVLESDGQVHRFSTSRGFWGEKAAEEDIPPCEEESCLSSDGIEVQDEPESPTARTTIRERLAKCGGKSVVMRVVECHDGATGEVTKRREFVCRLEVSVAAVAARLRVTLSEGRKRLAGLSRSNLWSLADFRERVAT